jgi:hypothetical protein
MGTALNDETLDQVLATQIVVAWAGETAKPARLGWWKTDVIDPNAGGDLMERLLPRTHLWAALEAAREAARRSDEKARVRMGTPDKLRSLFFLGFAVDEALADRFASLKAQGRPPVEVLRIGPVQEKFSKDSVEALLGRKAVKVTVVPGGRQLKGPMPGDFGDLVRDLAAALIPLVDEYPLPFFKVGA